MASSRKMLFIAVTAASVMSYPILNQAIHPLYKAETNRPERTIIVTGASGNLGRSITYHLAKRNCRVIMACRDMDKCKSFRREIVLHTGNKGVVCRHLDLEDFDSINKFADDMIKTEPHIDVLINNAGVKKTNGREITKYGIERHLFVNFLAPYLLTFRLLEKLEESAKITRDSRIINMIGAKPKKSWNVNLEDINFDKRSFNNTVAYRQSKLALAYFTILLDKFNRSKKNCVYLFGMAPSTHRISESFDRENGILASLYQLPQEYLYHHPERLIQAVVRCALDPGVIFGGSGKLYSYFWRPIGFNGGWGVAAKDELKAKLVWNKAAELLLMGPEKSNPTGTEQDQVKQDENSKPSVVESE